MICVSPNGTIATGMGARERKLKMCSYSLKFDMKINNNKSPRPLIEEWQGDHFYMPVHLLQRDAADNDVVRELYFMAKQC